MPDAAFISYRRKPSAALAALIQEKLKNQHKISAYLDTMRAVSNNVQFPNRLMSAIAEAPVFICVLGDTTLDSEWVLKEIERAYELQKPCIPVFQETFNPPDAPSNPAINYLLEFDAVRILDVQSLYMDIAIKQIAAHIKRFTKNQDNTVVSGGCGRAIVTGLSVLALLIIMLVFFALILPMLNAVNATPTPPPVTQLITAPTTTTEFTLNVVETIGQPAVATETESPTATHTLTAIAIETTDFNLLALTFDAGQTQTQDALYAAATLTESAIQTATVTQWTPVPTVDRTQEFASFLTERAAMTQTQVAIEQATIIVGYTDTPTPTPSATPTATHTPTPTLNPLTATVTAAYAFNGDNDDWTPVEQVFNGVTMVLVPPGCFMMGSDAQEYEQPIHEQCFNAPFWIDKYEVTNAQFAAFDGVAEQASKWTDVNRPRENITWFEARDFCALRGARLPTEREWEYAARGPSMWVYPWGDEFDADKVVYADNSGGQTANVGSRLLGKSWVGAIDMSGNVWEWVSTLYRDYPYFEGDGREADTGLRTDVMRGLRGGSFRYNLDYLRSAHRDASNSNDLGDYIGFRCARS